MTQEEFLAAFAEAAPDFIWQLNYIGEIRGWYRDCPRYFCPVTAVALKKTGKHLELNAGFAAECLNIENVAVIIQSADHKQYFDGYDKELRLRLLNITGLTEISR